MATLVEPELEDTVRKWWDSLKEFHEPSKGKSALVRLDERHYVLCLPVRISAEQAERMRETWVEFAGKRGPKLMVFSDSVFVPRLEEA